MGQIRHCVEYKQRGTKGGRVLRCARFARNRGGGAQSPACDPRLKGGGRSPGLLRARGCPRKRRSR